MMFGVFIDVTVRKLAEEAREMITEEMNHRIKNLFAIALVLTSISARSVFTKEEMVNDLTQRLAALSDAHDLFRTNPNKQNAAGLLGNLLAVLRKPYADEVSEFNRVNISAPVLLVGELSATAIALIIHELATNSIKLRSTFLQTWSLGYHLHCQRTSRRNCLDREGRTSCFVREGKERLWK
jgi:two-component sensor histidine kinase